MKEKLCLDAGWRVRQCMPGGDAVGEWMPADMPAQVHEVLLGCGLLADPREFRGSEKCQWVADQDWIYELDFEFRETGTYRQALEFEGVDTLADFSLNGEWIGHHCDQYLPAVIDVTGRLKAHNVLSIRFQSPNVYLQDHPLPEDYQGHVRGIRALRKGDHDFDDYLGAKPRFTKIGLYGHVNLLLGDIAEIAGLEIKTEFKDGFAQAMVCARLTTAGLCTAVSAKFELFAPDGKILATKSMDTDSGPDSSCCLEWKTPVDKPLLWWPRGFGDQPLYKLAAVLVSDEGEILDRCIKPFGMRDLEVDMPFNFRINGVQVKLWGANFTPMNGLTHVYDHARAKNILDLVEIGNMNALRIWGGGDNVEDEFYDETDKRGILVWQEFPNEFGMHPDTENIRDLCRQEAEYYVGKLRHHPSIILWCGGNENYMGRDFVYPGEKFIGREIFHIDYREIVSRMDPHRPYLESSPYGGAYANDPLSGDTHGYTNTWFVPGADIPVFHTENLRVSLPSVKSLERYVGRENLWPEGYDGRVTLKNRDPWPAAWNHVTSAASWRKIPPIEHYYDPSTVEELVYNFGWAHGEYLRKTVEAYRRGKSWHNPFDERKCLGHLVWKLFASWPHLYGNVLDYYLEPGIAFYAMKRTYSQLLLSFEVSDFIFVWLTNDSPYDFEGKVRIRLFEPMENRVFMETEVWARVRAGKSELIANLNEFGQFDRQNLLYAYVERDQCSWQGKSGEGFDGLAARSLDYVDIERHLGFPDAGIALGCDGDTLVLTTDRFARSIELSGDEDGDAFGWYFEDNFFDLLPGETKRVKVFGKHGKGTIRAKAAYTDHFVETGFDCK
ncbi:MAG TPA: glycoside hydrolase family 2 protein [Clostridia bacterium]